MSNFKRPGLDFGHRTALHRENKAEYICLSAPFTIHDHPRGGTFANLLARGVPDGQGREEAAGDGDEGREEAECGVDAVLRKHDDGAGGVTAKFHIVDGVADLCVGWGWASVWIGGWVGG